MLVQTEVFLICLINVAFYEGSQCFLLLLLFLHIFYLKCAEKKFTEVVVVFVSLNGECVSD